MSVSPYPHVLILLFHIARYWVLKYCVHYVNIILQWTTNCCVDYFAAIIDIDLNIPTQSGTVPVKSVFGWIIIHQRFGYTDWHRTWAEYKAGFGSRDADFWLGLERMHLLTSSQPYRLRVRVWINDQSCCWFSFGTLPYRNTIWFNHGCVHHRPTVLP